MQLSHITEAADGGWTGERCGSSPRCVCCMSLFRESVTRQNSCLLSADGTLDQLLTDVAFQVCNEMVEAASVGCPGREHVCFTISWISL